MAEFVEGGPATEELPDEMQAMFDLSKMKKKKKKKGGEDDSGATAQAASSDSLVVCANTETLPTYTYTQLLTRIVSYLEKNNPELSEKRRNTLKPPQLMRVGTKKTLWINFQEICSKLQRNSEHVYQFMLAELGTEGSIDAQQRFLIKGKIIPKYIETILRKYIIEYVTCQMCRSFNTTLTKDSVTRLSFVQCSDCGSSRSVSQIKAGYHAQTKADRRAIRNAT